MDEPGMHNLVVTASRDDLHSAPRKLSGLLSVSLYDGGREVSVEGLPRPFLLRIPHAFALPENSSAECRWWNESAQEYDTSGCWVHEELDDATVCACTHLTGFALSFRKGDERFLAPPRLEWPPPEAWSRLTVANLMAYPLPSILLLTLMSLFLIGFVFAFRFDKRMVRVYKFEHVFDLDKTFESEILGEVTLPISRLLEEKQLSLNLHGSGRWGSDDECGMRAGDEVGEIQNLQQGLQIEHTCILTHENTQTHTTHTTHRHAYKNNRQRRA
jgi:hypothetical protein